MGRVGVGPLVAAHRRSGRGAGSQRGQRPDRRMPRANTVSQRARHQTS